jgi:hypothetical protein
LAARDKAFCFPPPFLDSLSVGRNATFVQTIRPQINKAEQKQALYNLSAAYIQQYRPKN